MIKRCPSCGYEIVIKGLGRNPLDIPFKKVSDALQTYRYTKAAAEDLGCSVAYIYQECGKKGLKPGDIIGKR
jgi:DNA-directed RNA polymerase subunit RPC12/RpoP